MVFDVSVGKSMLKDKNDGAGWEDSLDVKKHGSGFESSHSRDGQSGILGLGLVSDDNNRISESISSVKLDLKASVHIEGRDGQVSGQNDLSLDSFELNCSVELLNLVDESNERSLEKVSILLDVQDKSSLLVLGKALGGGLDIHSHACRSEGHINLAAGLQRNFQVDELVSLFDRKSQSGQITSLNHVSFQSNDPALGCLHDQFKNGINIDHSLESFGLDIKNVVGNEESLSLIFEFHVEGVGSSLEFSLKVDERGIIPLNVSFQRIFFHINGASGVQDQFSLVFKLNAKSQRSALEFSFQINERGIKPSNMSFHSVVIEFSSQAKDVFAAFLKLNSGIFHVRIELEDNINQSFALINSLDLHNMDFFSSGFIGSNEFNNFSFTLDGINLDNVGALFFTDHDITLSLQGLVSRGQFGSQ